MQIPSDNPIIVPPAEQKEFPDVWISSIIVHAPDAQNGSITIEFKPYNFQNKEIFPETTGSIWSGDLWRAVQEVPEVAQAMGAIFAAVEPLRQWANNPENQ